MKRPEVGALKDGNVGVHEVSQVQEMDAGIAQRARHDAASPRLPARWLRTWRDDDIMFALKVATSG